MQGLLRWEVAWEGQREDPVSPIYALREDVSAVGCYRPRSERPQRAMKNRRGANVAYRNGPNPQLANEADSEWPRTLSKPFAALQCNACPQRSYWRVLCSVGGRLWRSAWTRGATRGETEQFLRDIQPFPETKVSLLTMAV